MCTVFVCFSVSIYRICAFLCMQCKLGLSPWINSLCIPDPWEEDETDTVYFVTILFYTLPLTKKMMNSGVTTNWNIYNRMETNVTAHFSLFFVHICVCRKIQYIELIHFILLD